MQVVNGHEFLRKFVGKHEKTARDIFTDDENDQKTRGELFRHLSFVIPLRHSEKVLWKIHVSLKVLCAYGP